MPRYLPLMLQRSPQTAREPVFNLPPVIVGSIVVLLAIGCAYAGLAAAARDFFRSTRAIRALNRTAGVVMASAAAFVIARE